MGVVVPARVRHALRALRHSDFRLYWVGQWISVTGTWMQTMALSWLVYRLSDSPLVLGFLAAARFGPSLIGSPLAGVVADRFARRRLVLVTQSIGLVQASVLTALTLSGAVQLWHLLSLAALQGVVDSLDMPARQTLQVDLVGLDDLASAVSLNSSAFNAGRMVGPAAAGILVGAFGEGICFLINAISYLAVLIALLAIRGGVGQPPPMRSSIRRELLDGLGHVWRSPAMRGVLSAVVITSTFGFSYSTLLPVLARDVLRGGATGYGALLAGAGVGAIAGAMAAASRRKREGTRTIIATAQLGLGVGLIVLASTRDLRVAVLAMVGIGTAVALQLSTSNVFLQSSAPPELRGRVISIYIWLFVGLAPLGGLLAGWAAEHAGASWTAAGAGLGCLLSGVALAVRRRGEGAPSGGTS